MAIIPSASYSLTMRVEIPSASGSFASVAAAIGEAGGDVGAIAARFCRAMGKALPNGAVHAPAAKYNPAGPLGRMAHGAGLAAIQQQCPAPRPIPGEQLGSDPAYNGKILLQTEGDLHYVFG